MDYNEVVRGFVYRHPWELSRTKSIHSSWKKYYSRFENTDCRYVNVGAGDCFFDETFVTKYGYKLTAVDIAYPDEPDAREGIIQVHSLDKTSGDFSFGVMMDSLEYMDDDVLYIKELSEKIRPGGYIFLTLPACTRLFSDHDILVGNKRRYDYKDIEKLVDQNEGLQLVEVKSFYWTLFLIRCIQKLFNAKANEKVTTGWSHSEDSFVTKFFLWALNADYDMCRFLPLKGLSWRVVIKKTE